MRQMRLLCYALFLLVLPTGLFAQQSQLDSLEELLQSNIPDTNKIQIYRTVIWAYTRPNPEKSLQLTRELEAIGEKHNHIKAKMLAYYYFGSNYKNQGKYPLSLDYFQRYHDYYSSMNDTIQLANVLYQLGVVYRYMGDYPKAFECFNECIEFDEILGRMSSMATTVSVRAGLFRSLNQLDRALSDQLLSLEIFRSENDRSGEGGALMNIGNVYGDMRENEKALIYYDSSEVIARELNDEYYIAFLYENKANVFTNIGAIEEAMDNYQKSLVLCQKLQRTENIVKLQNKIAILHNLDNHPETALQLATEALKGAEENQILPEKRQALKIISDSHKQLGNYEEALNSFALFSDVKDSLLNKDITEQLAHMDARFETSKKEGEIERLSMEQELSSIKLSQQRFALLMSIIIVFTLIILLYNNQKKSKKISDQADIIKKSLAEKELLLKEIHHRVKNNLQVISSLLKLQSERVVDKRAQEALDEGRNRVRSMAIIHQNLYQKDNLSGIGMQNYLDQLIDELQDSYQIQDDRIQIKMDVQDIYLDVDSAVPIGLIINELISNCMKHAFPNKKNGQIEIQLKKTEEGLYLKVSDNGVGYNPANVKSTSFGQELIVAFAERLRSKYTIDGTNGTTATFLIQDYKLAA